VDRLAFEKDRHEGKGDAREGGRTAVLAGLLLGLMIAAIAASGRGAERAGAPGRELRAPLAGHEPPLGRPGRRY
jgi:hypothetical protein